ncbi:Ceramide glucosyltransferase [Cytospora mali]|uniref:Ceramide glucosyltransferase n=1 Tax=Cytospora mali TaxID=578113 RepID=A0A194USU5_CYTMA|nr:Ceramide glucosyltransferase [Valsa mali var. pyri (nom. inval.)]
MSFLLPANIAVYVAIPALIWSSVVYLVQSIGIFKLFRHYSQPPRKAISPCLPEDELPHISIIRPVKGLEPQLYECLASTFRQVYPRSKLTINLCISSDNDPAYPVLEQIVEDFGKDGFDVRLLVEEYDPVLSSLDEKDEYGPNPKIRNISRAYREAPPDSLIWILDCNVWICPDVAGHMVDKLLGYLPEEERATPFKFVHQLPLVVDIPPFTKEAKETGHDESTWQRVWRLGGGRLDEMFMATTHAKFYGAINTVGIAPCILGKSNMFRKQHLDTYTLPQHNRNLSLADAKRGRGIDFFSSYICEDHLIGDLLWNADIPGFSNHGLVWGDLAIQPMSEMSVAQYWARRVRWLRVRKWTVLLATLVEPGVESILCNLYFSYAITTLSFFNTTFAISQTWTAMCGLWLAGVLIWMTCDRAVYRRLHSCSTVVADKNTPFFARGAGQPGGVDRKPFLEWLPAWLGRETLAFPIWTWAVLLGTTVSWRGKTFRVRRDMSVVALQVKGETSAQNGHAVAGGMKGTFNGSTTDNGTHREVPKWEGRPTATQRKSRSYAKE